MDNITQYPEELWGFSMISKVGSFLCFSALIPHHTSQVNITGKKTTG